MAGKRSPARRKLDAATSRVLSAAARLDKVTPGAGDALCLHIATTLTGSLQRYLDGLAGDSAVPQSAFRKTQD